MNVAITFFGQLTDITKAQHITVTGVADTQGLLEELYVQFPDLRSAQFIIAVDDEIILTNTALKEKSTIALMPQFSGG